MMKILGIGAVGLLLFWFQQWIYRRLWLHNLKVSLRFAQEGIFEGETGELLEVIENRKRLPLSMLKVKFQTSRNLVFADVEGNRVTDLFYRNDVFQVGMGERITRTLSFTGSKRGYYKICGIDLVAADLFLTTEMVESIEADHFVYVYPRPFDSSEFRLSLKQQNGEILTKRHLYEDPFEYRGIREYQPYDDMKSVNWKATARTQELKVNQKNYTSLQTIRIFLNVEDTGILKKEEAVETAVKIAAGLAEFFLRQGIRVSCYGNGLDVINGEPMALEASAGSGQMDRIYRALARCQTGDKTTDFAEAFRERIFGEDKGTITFFIAPNGYESFLGLLLDYQDAGGDFVWFYPVCDKNEPKLPGKLEGRIKVIHAGK